jgi:hypothetical protein
MGEEEKKTRDFNFPNAFCEYHISTQRRLPRHKDGSDPLSNSQCLAVPHLTSIP